MKTRKGRIMQTRFEVYEPGNTKGSKNNTEGDLVSIMPVCVCPKVKEMGSFSVSSE